MTHITTFSLRFALFGVFALTSAACSVQSGSPEESTGTSEDAITMAECAKPANRSKSSCFVEAVVTGTFSGEVDPFVVGDTCIVFAREVSGSRTWGLLEDFDTCRYARRYEGGEGSVIRFHKGRMTSLSARKRTELRGLNAEAVFYDHAGDISDVETPDNAFTLECRPTGDPCARRAALGYCLGNVRITQIGDERVSVIVREGERASSRHSVYVPRSPSIGGRSDEGALPESLSASIDADHWISLELDEDDLSKMKGTFSFNEAVRFPGEFESIDVTCDGSL